MPNLTDMKERMRSLAIEGQKILDDEAIPRPEKLEQLKKIQVDTAELSKQIDEENFLAEQRKAFDVTTAGESTEDETKPEVRSFGEQFISSDAYKSVSGGQRKGSRWSTGAVEMKATMTTAASAIVQPDVQAGITPILFQRLTVADLMASGQTSSNLVRYLKETTATNAAAAVAEEGAKPESTIVLDEVDEPVRKVATILKVTDEMFEDAPAVRSYVDSRLRLFVQIEEEDQLLNGSGVAPNLTGLRNRSGLQTDVAYTTGVKADSIYEQMTAIRANAFLEPDGIVVHPNDWASIRLAKDANDQYYGPGPFARDADQSLWGLRVVVTTAITEGVALVGAFMSASQVFRKGGVTVEATNSDQDDFIKNRITLRAEERLALAVYRPGAFGEVTGLKLPQVVGG